MLTVLIIFLSAVLDKAGNKDIRILISSVTNVAVDRILQGLVDLGYTDFIRVGSLKKISKTILPYMIQIDKEKSENIRDLREMLKEPMTAAEAKAVKETLDMLEGGIAEKKKSTMSTE